MPKNFELQSWTHPVPVEVADGLPIVVDEEALLKFPAFDNWLKSLQENLSRQESLRIPIILIHSDSMDSKFTPSPCLAATSVS
jgi:hypothetical protein